MNLAMPSCNLGPFFYEEMQATDAGLQSHQHNQEPEMKLSQMIQSKYLKKEDLDEDVIVTVDRVEQQNVAQDGQPEEKKWVLYFLEYDKGLVLNSTNIQLLENATGASDTKDLPGREVILYVDPNVSFGGKVVGGLRIRKHQIAAPVRPAGRALPAAATRSPTKSVSQEFAEQDIPAD